MTAGAPAGGNGTGPAPGPLPTITPLAERDAGQVLRIAHRALELLGPDPDAACAAVRSAGGHLIEVDARVTADGTLVVAHDARVAAGGTSREVEDLPESAVLAADPTVLPLPAALAAIRRHDLGLYLDIKSIDRGAARALGAALADAGLEGTSILASARSDAVELCAEVLPGLPRAVLFAGEIADPVLLARSVDAQFVHPCWERFDAPHRMLPPEWIARARAAHLGIVTWHEERADVLAALVGLGVDGICTDDMALLTAIAGAACAGMAGGRS